MSAPEYESDLPDPKDLVSDLTGYLQTRRDLLGEKDSNGIVPDELIAEKWGVAVGAQDTKKDEWEKKKEELITHEKAREILGEDFLGYDELVKLQETLKANGMPIKRVVYNGNPLHLADVEAAKVLGERVIVLPIEFVISIDGSKVETRLEPTLNNIVALTTPALTGKTPDKDPWFRDAWFAQYPRNQLPKGVLFIKKEPLPGLRGLPSELQKEAIDEYARQLPNVVRETPQLPTISEAVLAHLMFSVNREGELFPSPARTSTNTVEKEVVCFNGNNESGYLIGSLPPADKFSDIYLVR